MVTFLDGFDLTPIITLYRRVFFLLFLLIFQPKYYIRNESMRTRVVWVCVCVCVCSCKWVKEKQNAATAQTNNRTELSNHPSIHLPAGWQEQQFQPQQQRQQHKRHNTYNTNACERNTIQCMQLCTVFVYVYIITSAS